MTVTCQAIVVCGRHDGLLTGVSPIRAAMQPVGRRRSSVGSAAGSHSMSVKSQLFVPDLTLNQDGYEVVPIRRLMRGFEPTKALSAPESAAASSLGK